MTTTTASFLPPLRPLRQPFGQDLHFNLLLMLVLVLCSLGGQAYHHH